MIKAKIQHDATGDTDTLWLFIEREDGETAHPILEDEVEAIANACIEYLEAHNPDLLKAKK